MKCSLPLSNTVDKKSRFEIQSHETFDSHEICLQLTDSLVHDWPKCRLIGGKPRPVPFPPITNPDDAARSTSMVAFYF